MRWKKEKAEKPPAERQPHPDPLTELKLQRIEELSRLRKQCYDLIEVQKAIIKSADSDLSAAASRRISPNWPISRSELEDIQRLTKDRLSRAEASIAAQQERSLSLSDEITSASAELSPSDLAFLAPSGTGKPL